MKKVLGFSVAIAVLGFLSYWSASHHVVQTKQGAIVMAKRFLTFADTFVDVRSWSSDDFEAHPELKKALADGGYEDLLAELKARERKAKRDGMKDKAASVAGEFADKVSDMAGDVAAEVSETAGEVADKVAETIGKE